MADPGAPLRLVCFELHAQELALPIGDVRETLPLVPITRVVLTPACLAGVFSLRGDIVPAIDLGILLGLPPTEIGDDSRIVVVEHATGSVGIVVDRLRDLRTIDALEPPPPSLPTAVAVLLRGVASTPTGSVRVLDANAILNAEPMQTLRAHAEGGIRMTKLRVPMFVKFLVGCLALAALLIVGGTYVVKNETKLKSRGNYLAQAERRLHGYVERVGRGMTGTVELLAADNEIREGLAKGDDIPHAKAAFEALSGKNGVQPDLFVVFTAANHLVWAPPGSPMSERDLPDLAAVEKVRTGSVFPHRIQVVNGVPYQVSAAPIRAMTADTVLGGMLIGVRLERYYTEWSEQSDDRPELRFRPSLLVGTNVLASSWPESQRADLARGIQPDKAQRIQIGEDVRDVVSIKEVGDFDFYGEDLQGYKAGDPGTVGVEVMTRSRVQISDPSANIPWTEIAVGILASVIIASLMAFLITRPIKQFVRQSRELLAGDTDLTQRLSIKSSDETGDLAENINQVFERLQKLATGVQSAAFQVGASSAEISAASRQMLTGIKEGTLRIESSTTAVTELSASIQQVAGNAAQATTVAEASSIAVTDAVKRMEQIRAAVDDAAEKMRELGESSKRIGNIVEVIRQISEQTSMLALNASIEAAHAGEQGRGFAVVADEVSSLARRVGQSAKDIEALIGTVKEQTAAAITSMEIGTREVGNGSMLVTSTLTGLGELITVVKDTAVAVQEQAVVSDEIARNMDVVRNIAGEVLTGSEESVVQAERLHGLAFELEESIGGFNLDGSTVEPARRPVAGPKPPRALPAAAKPTPKKNGRGAEAGD